VKDEEEERKREEEERGSGASWWASHAEWTGVTESRHVRWRGSDGMTQATWRVLCHGGV
jgi:hypothetical protein